MTKKLAQYDDKYAVIGNPIAHSKSPEIHTMFAEQFKDQPAGDMVYKDRVLAPLDGFAATIDRLRKEGYKGCNVTVPFKESAFQLSNSFSDHVYDAKVANTLKFSVGKIHAENTDGIGLVRDLVQNLCVDLTGKRLLLIGAGGAAKGVLFPLRHALRQAKGNITVTNRTEERLQHLARRNISVFSYDKLAGKSFDIVINATSASLSDENPLPKDIGNIFAPGALAYDMMYGRETPFMKFAREQGAATVSDGLGMLVEQAAEAFFIWCGVRPNTAPVLAKLRTL